MIKRDLVWEKMFRTHSGLFSLDSWTDIGAIFQRQEIQGEQQVLNGEGTNPLKIHGRSLAFCHASSNTSGTSAVLTEHVGLSA